MGDILGFTANGLGCNKLIFQLLDRVHDYDKEMPPGKLTDCRPTHGTVMKRQRTQTQHN